jgi:hypothetical protein
LAGGSIFFLRLDFRNYDVPKSSSLKRLLAIFFLVLFLFNAGGYYALHWVLSIKAEKDLITQIENEKYDLADEVTLAIPMALPYGELNADTYFEKMHGAFEYHGDQYKLIKQKLQNDTLYVVCVKNSAQKRVDSTIADYSKNANDVPSQTKQTLNLLSKLFKDFQQSTALTLESNFFLIDAQMSMAAPSVILDQTYPIFSPPPERVS